MNPTAMLRTILAAACTALAAGCAGPIVVPAWQPPAHDVRALQRVAVGPFLGEQGQSFREPFLTKIAASGTYQTPSTEVWQQTYNRFAADMNSRAAAIEAARSLGLDAVFVGDVLHYTAKMTDTSKSLTGEGATFQIGLHGIYIQEVSMRVQVDLVRVADGQSVAQETALRNWKRTSETESELPELTEIVTKLNGQVVDELIAKFACHQAPTTVKLVGGQIWEMPNLDLRTGYRSAQKGDWAQAAASWEKVVAAQPNNAKVWNSLGWAYVAQNQHSRAEGCFQKAASIDAASGDADGLKRARDAQAWLGARASELQARAAAQPFNPAQPFNSGPMNGAPAMLAQQGAAPGYGQPQAGYAQPNGPPQFAQAGFVIPPNGQIPSGQSPNGQLPNGPPGYGQPAPPQVAMQNPPQAGAEAAAVEVAPVEPEYISLRPEKVYAPVAAAPVDGRKPGIVLNPAAPGGTASRPAPFGPNASQAAAPPTQPAAPPTSQELLGAPSSFAVGRPTIFDRPAPGAAPNAGAAPAPQAGLATQGAPAANGYAAASGAPGNGAPATAAWNQPAAPAAAAAAPMMAQNYPAGSAPPAAATPGWAQPAGAPQQGMQAQPGMQPPPAAGPGTPWGAPAANGTPPGIQPSAAPAPVPYTPPVGMYPSAPPPGPLTARPIASAGRPLDMSDNPLAGSGRTAAAPASPYVTSPKNAVPSLPPGAAAPAAYGPGPSGAPVTAQGVGIGATSLGALPAAGPPAASLTAAGSSPPLGASPTLGAATPGMYPTQNFLGLPNESLSPQAAAAAKAKGASPINFAPKQSLQTNSAGQESATYPSAAYPPPSPTAITYSGPSFSPTAPPVGVIPAAASPPPSTPLTSGPSPTQAYPAAYPGSAGSGGYPAIAPSYPGGGAGMGMGVAW